VTAKDKATSKEQSIRIQANGGLSDADIEQMVKDAEAHSAEDKKRKELVEAKNQGEALVHATEKSLSEFGDKIPEGDKAAIEAAKAELKTALEGEDADDIKQKTQALSQASMKMGEAMYAAGQGAEGEQPTAGAAGHADDGVVDAEFEEVDEHKS
jgi:molecular chaperone DnaK